MTAASCFVDVSDEFLDKFLDNSIPKKTKKEAKYGMKILFLVDEITNIYSFLIQIKLTFFDLNKCFQDIVTSLL